MPPRGDQTTLAAAAAAQNIPGSSGAAVRLRSRAFHLGFAAKAVRQAAQQAPNQEASLLRPRLTTGRHPLRVVSWSDPLRLGSPRFDIQVGSYSIPEGHTRRIGMSLVKSVALCEIDR